MTDWLLNFPLGTLLGWFIDQFNSYGWGLLGFTVAIKIILLPLGLLQQRSTINQMKVRPQEEAIRKQCGADKMRANLEVSNLYKENGISAAAGCLPMLVQLPILFSLYKIIRMPLTYVVKLSASQISALDAALGLNLSACRTRPKSPLPRRCFPTCPPWSTQALSSLASAPSATTSWA
mgnify:CR=1 FL=1